MFVDRDIATFTKEAVVRLCAAQDEVEIIRLAIRDSRALIEATRMDIAYLNRLARWRVGEASSADGGGDIASVTDIPGPTR